MDSIGNTQTSTVYLSLGTNIGDRLVNLTAALDAMPPVVKPLAHSPVYRTSPWGFADQPDFLNQVIKAETVLPPLELLAYLKKLEAQLGRQPSFHYGPRLIDLDILFYDDLVLKRPELIIPHPHLHERAFVLKPLVDLAPDLRHPVLGKTVKELLEEVDKSQIEIFTGN
jgi:2-amino-4-hydroxy-6-hydroxymethyldihydropteridine diphosphokinase